MTDVLWQADASGVVTDITPCRPSAVTGQGQLDEVEVHQVEQLWHKATRCAERFSAIYHVHAAGSQPRTFLVRSVPVLDDRDRVLYWSGLAAETDGLAEGDTRFISEAASVLSSSLNREIIINRLAQASIQHFADLCVIHTFDDESSMHVQGIADRRTHGSDRAGAIEPAVKEAVRTRQPLLLLSAARHDLTDEKLERALSESEARSMIVVPLFVGAACIASLTFAESERASSFAPRDRDIAVVVGRQLVMALENIATFEREQRHTERFRFLARITERLFATLDSAKMLQHLLDELAEGFSDAAVAGSVLGGRLHIVAASGTRARFHGDAEREMVAALRDRRSILSGGKRDLGGKRPPPGPFADGPSACSWMMAPLFVGDTVYGAIVCSSNERRFEAGELEMLEEVGRRASLALEHAESFARERRLIQTLQQATLPTKLARVEGASLSAVYRPAASEVQVGGDWYDAYDLDRDRVLLTVGDVTGHGLEASIVMGKLRHAINVIALYERDPVRILDTAEQVLLRRFPGSIATAFVAIFDSSTRTITYANAGHPYPLLRGADGSLRQLAAEGLPIGLRSIGPSVTSITEQIDGAALLAFYTDGLVEATRDMLAGETRLHAALGSEAIAYVENPAQFVEDFCVGGQSPDDVAILVLNFVDARRWTFDSHDSRAARLARHEFLEHLEAFADPACDLSVAELIFGELTANVAQHAAGQLEVAFERRGSRAVLHVIDRGNGYAPAELREADPFTEHGRGLWLVRRLGAELSVELLPGFGTHHIAVLPVDANTTD
ncbi:MAG: SpoIIE family protein phosphatase [Candidatus Eremiobacteraeota bacterium]|nr:SpoIIE family protein phosphatase [Candidatus Eremiobacteraeota bacterium]